MNRIILFGTPILVLVTTLIATAMSARICGGTISMSSITGGIPNKSTFVCSINSGSISYNLFFILGAPLITAALSFLVIKKLQKK